jgi:hypothetical protein
MDNVSADKLVKAYIKIRDRRKQLTDEYETQDKELEESQDMISEKLLDVCKTMGANGFNTEFGTVSRRVSKRFWTNDWHSFHKFLLEHQMPELLEKRIAQTNMATFLEENPDLLPPGLNVDSKYTISIRRKT